MDSGKPSSACACDTCVRAPKPLLILAGIYVALLSTVGIIILPKWGGALIPISLPVAVFPALIYATAIFRYGNALFGDPLSAQRARAWLRLLWITAFLYAAVCAIVVIIDILAGLAENDGSTIMRSWAYHFVVAIAMALLVIWAYIGGTVFVRDSSSLFHTKPALSTNLLGVFFLLGGFMMLCSLAFNVGYECTGWSVLSRQGAWVTNDFIEINALRSWLNGLTLASYVAGLVLALLALTTGVVTLAQKQVTQKNVSIVLNASIVIFWFTLTNYYFDCFYYAFIGPFNFGLEKGNFAVITAIWLLMFIAGVALWFKYRNRSDKRGRTIRTALMVWYLPLIPAAITTFWIAADYGLFGLILYVAGLQCVTACLWKMWMAQDTLVPTHGCNGMEPTASKTSMSLRCVSR